MPDLQSIHPRLALGDLPLAATPGHVTRLLGPPDHVELHHPIPGYAWVYPQLALSLYFFPAGVLHAITTAGPCACHGKDLHHAPWDSLLDEFVAAHQLRHHDITGYALLGYTFAHIIPWSLTLSCTDGLINSVTLTQ